MPRYLTKSRFKLALECVTKLYYTGKKQEYADQNLSDPFLEALAKGGFQVGELAKYYFSDNPVADDITVNTLDYDEAVRITNEKLMQPGRVVVAEAAFLFNDLFIRADIVIKENNTISLYEVKAKSMGAEIETDFSFLNKKGNKVSAEWEPYLYDLAFQKHVVSQSQWGEGYNIKAHLLLADKEATATIDGLNQKFKIIKDDRWYKVITPEGLIRDHLGEQILREINCDAVIDKIWNDFEVPSDFEPGISFLPFIDKIKDLYANDERYYTRVGSKCKLCQFKNDGNGDNLKSGFWDCWKQHTNYSDELLSGNLVTEIWGGHSGSVSHIDNLIQNQIFLLADAKEEMLQPKNSKPEKNLPGLSPHARRMEQVKRIKEGIRESFIDKEGLKTEMASWKYPLHMIDFETSMVALPFHVGSKPYQGVAFQFSQHVIREDGSVEHKGQFLATQPGVFPNYDFVRALKQELELDNGTVFRYHNHENTYLVMIAGQLENDTNPPADKDELLAFIKSITRRRNGKEFEYGERAMVDLYDLVLRFYYPPFAKGSNSLKKILPSIINDSEFLREKYGRPGIYGKNLPVKSLNFEDHVWITEETGNDPYKTLPNVFGRYCREQLDDLVKDFEELGDGGAALTAYNYLQFSEVPDEQRNSIAEALLRYCELDTMAMVMLVEGWREMAK